MLSDPGGSFGAAVEVLRIPLTGYCYRMLGSGFEAEDAVQATFERAWRSRADFDEGRASVRTWLFAIATNICLDMLRSSQRRARAMGFSDASAPGPNVGTPLPDESWILPVPDARAVPTSADPAEIVTQRETIRFAFVAALQQLPPRQRAALILVDVFRLTAVEVAALLDTSQASVNSALQRARATINSTSAGHGSSYDPLDPHHAALLARYCDAFERYDIDGMVSVMRDDVTMSMPPLPWWIQGREQIRRALSAADRPCEGARLVPTSANGSPAFAQYRPVGPGERDEPFALTVLDIADGLISDITTFLDAERLFPLFDLPDR